MAEQWLYDMELYFIDRIGTMRIFLESCRRDDVKIVDYIFRSRLCWDIYYYIEDKLGYLLRDEYLNVSKYLIKNIEYKDKNLMDSCCYHGQIFCADHLHNEGYKIRNTSIRYPNSIRFWLQYIIGYKINTNLRDEFVNLAHTTDIIEHKDPIDVLLEYYELKNAEIGLPLIKCDICHAITGEGYVCGCSDLTNHIDSNNYGAYVMFRLKYLKYEIIIKPYALRS